MQEDPLLIEAQTAIELHDKKKAREILRRLIKADPKNINYWLWLSVSVDTAREISYCLKEVLKIDPENVIAKKGLIFLGAQKPQPNSADDLLSQKRNWKQEYIKRFTPPPPEKKPKKVKKHVSRWIWMGLIVVLAVSASLISGFPWSRFKKQAAPVILTRPSAKPSATYLPTKTPFGYIELPTATSMGPVPPWELLEITYTPTPLYVNTPHSTEAYLLAMRAYGSGDYEKFRLYMDQAIIAEPKNADFYYYLAEVDKIEGRINPALLNYDKALAVDPKFSPAYLGRARMKILLSPTSAYINDINRAIENDANYSEAYLERARYYIKTHKIPEAKNDLEMVLRINPQTPIAHALLSEIYLSMDEPEKALKSARTANNMDVTMVQSYLALGSAYIANGRLSESVEPLQIYKEYAPLDARVYELLGVAYWAANDIDQTMEMMNRSIELDPLSFNPFLIRGLANLEMDNWTAAIEDLTKALTINDNSFDAVYNRAKAFLYQGRNTDAYNQLLRSENLMEDEKWHAEVIYFQAKAAMAMGDRLKTIDAWKRLMSLPEASVPKAYSDQAKSYLYPCNGSTCPTFTPSPTLQPTPCNSTNCPTNLPLPSTNVSTPTP